jgi:hypothetical protein
MPVSLPEKPKQKLRNPSPTNSGYNETRNVGRSGGSFALERSPAKDPDESIRCSAEPTYSGRRC